MALPRAEIEIKAAGLQIVAVAVVDGVAEQVLKPPLRAAEIIERQAEVALALVRGVIHDRQQAVSFAVFPGKRDEAVPGPIAVPSRHAFQQSPAAVAHDGLTQHCQQPLVERMQLRVASFLRARPRCGEMRFLRPSNWP